MFFMREYFKKIVMMHKKKTADNKDVSHRNADIYIDRWYYSMPEKTPDKDGNIVLIKEASFGPLEVYEWGFDSNMKPYKHYEWLENDFYADDNYHKEISKEELVQSIKNVMEKFRSIGRNDVVEAYEDVLLWMKNM